VEGNFGVTFAINDDRYSVDGVSFTYYLPYSRDHAYVEDLWLSWFVKYDPDWKDHPIERQERVVKEQMNNW